MEKIASNNPEKILQDQLDWISKSFDPGVIDPYVFVVLKEYAREWGVELKMPLDIKS